MRMRMEKQFERAEGRLMAMFMDLDKFKMATTCTAMGGR